MTKLGLWKITFTYTGLVGQKILTEELQIAARCVQGGGVPNTVKAEAQAVADNVYACYNIRACVDYAFAGFVSVAL